MSPSTTTTTTTESSGVLNLSGHQDGEQTISSVPLSESRALPLDVNTAPNPEGWPTIRGTPRYNPYDTTLDFAERPFGRNGVEAGFVAVMLSGVLLTGVSRSVASHLCRGFIN